ncbi:hypothetical protein J6O48_12400 [bacterium]|nr:hypothetical protein [bacterium]
MIEKISSTSNCYPKRLKNFFKKGIQYTSYNKFVPQTERAVVGNIPIEIINLFEPKEKKEKILAFQQALSDTAKYVRDVNEERMIDHNQDSKYCIDAILKKRGISAKDFLNKKLKHVLPEGYNADFEYVNYGGFKDVYKLGLKDNNNNKIMHDKAFHVYRYLSEITEFGKEHGNCAECNLWIYLSYRAGHPLNNTQFTKHYISDLHSGYSLTEFADKDITKTKNTLNVKDKLFIRYKDKDHNRIIHKKIYDIGGFEKTPLYTDDKMVIRYYRQIANRTSEKEKQQVLSQLETKIQNPKTPHRDKMIKGIELFKETLQQEQKR